MRTSLASGRPRSRSASRAGNVRHRIAVQLGRSGTCGLAAAASWPSGTASAVRPPGMNSGVPRMSPPRRRSALANCLDWRVAPVTSFSRVTGSATSEPSGMNMAETRLPPVPCLSATYRDGHRCRQGRSGESACREYREGSPTDQRRRRTCSPSRSGTATSLDAARRARHATIPPTRSGEMGPLNRVRGALDAGRPSSSATAGRGSGARGR